jgi:hypothetical protein
MASGEQDVNSRFVRPSIHQIRQSRSTIAVVPDRVRNERVFRARQIPLYALLSLINVAAVAWVADFWASRAEWSAQTPAYELLTRCSSCAGSRSP